MTCWVKLQSKSNSQNKCDKEEDPNKENQSISGKFKSPTKIHLEKDERISVK